MKSQIIKEKPRVVMHKVNQKDKLKLKEVNIWRGLDQKTVKYILTNKYYPVKILELNDLSFLKTSVATA